MPDTVIGAAPGTSVWLPMMNLPFIAAVAICSPNVKALGAGTKSTVDWSMMTFESAEGIYIALPRTETVGPPGRIVWSAMMNFPSLTAVITLESMDKSVWSLCEIGTVLKTGAGSLWAWLDSKLPGSLPIKFSGEISWDPPGDWNCEVAWTGCEAWTGCKTCAGCELSWTARVWTTTLGRTRPVGWLRVGVTWSAGSLIDAIKPAGWLNVGVTRSGGWLNVGATGLAGSLVGVTWSTAGRVRVTWSTSLLIVGVTGSASLLFGAPRPGGSLDARVLVRASVSNPTLPVAEPTAGESCSVGSKPGGSRCVGRLGLSAFCDNDPGSIWIFVGEASGISSVWAEGFAGPLDWGSWPASDALNESSGRTVGSTVGTLSGLDGDAFSAAEERGPGVLTKLTDVVVKLDTGTSTLGGLAALAVQFGGMNEFKSRPFEIYSWRRKSRDRIVVKSKHSRFPVPFATHDCEYTRTSPTPW